MSLPTQKPTTTPIPVQFRQDGYAVTMLPMEQVVGFV
jgi:hypothetical protein